MQRRPDHNVLSTSIPAQEVSRVDAAAARLGVSRARFIRNAVLDHVERAERTYQRRRP